MSERNKGLQKPPESEIREVFASVSSLVGDISAGDRDSVYALRGWWADNVSNFVFGDRQPADLKVNNVVGKYGVPVDGGKLYCSRQIDQVELDDEQRGRWGFLRASMAGAAAEGLRNRWGQEEIDKGLASASDDEKKRAVVQKWVGGGNGPLSGLEGEILASLEGIVDDEEIGFNGSEETRKDQVGGERDDVLRELTGVLKDLKDQMGQEDPSSHLSDAQDEYYQRRSELERKMETMSIEELVDSYLNIKAPRERAPQLWEYNVPEWMPGVSVGEWRELLSYQDLWLGSIYRKRNNKEYNNSLRDMPGMILGMMTLGEEDLEPWFNHPVLKVREVMRQIMKELLVPNEVTAGGQSAEFFAFETTKNEKGALEYSSQFVKEFIKSESGYKFALAERLVENKTIKHVNAAKLSVAMAMDIMEMGGVFSLADTGRRLGWESDVVRLVQRPETKFLTKVAKGEIWGGVWTDYALSLTDNSKQAAKLLESLGVVPKLLAGSFLDITRFEDKKSFGKRIWDGDEFDLDEDISDLYFGWRKDHIMIAADMWAYISGEVPFELSKQREVDNVASEWRRKAFNAWQKLKVNGDALAPVELVTSAIGASVGLWPFAGPYLRAGAGGDLDSYNTMYQAGLEMLSGMGLSVSEEKKVMDIFGLDKAYMRDFNEKMTDFRSSRNPGASPRAIKRYKLALRRKKEKNRI